MATKPSYKYNLALDEECKRITDELIATGKAISFSDAVRYCIRKQKRIIP